MNKKFEHKGYSFSIDEELEKELNEKFYIDASKEIKHAIDIDILTNINTKNKMENENNHENQIFNCRIISIIE